ncbi:MAG: polysaccharide biosynthesis protein [Bacilli bacterium]|nr:polysaccharide biosynthesis protein [Bacilli bacterium]
MTKSRNLHFIYAIADVIICFLVTTISFVSFYGVSGFKDNIISSFIYAGSISLATLIVFFILKIYKIITTQISILDAVKIIFVTLGIHVTGLIVITVVPQLPRFTDFVFAWLLSTGFLIFSHVSIRVAVRVFNMASVVGSKTNKVRTLVIGAGATGKVVIDESRRNPHNHNKIIVMVDDDPNKIGGLFSNIPIKGPIKDIAKIIDYTKAQEVIIAMSKISQDRLHEIINLLNSCNVRVRRMPLIEEMQGPNDKRIIDVDLNDLLSRDPVILDNHEVKDMLHEKCVMVTGAGGSIGSELVRQIFKTHPKTLILFDIYENSTYDIQMELTRKIREEKIKDIQLVTLIGSTYNETRVEQIIKKYKPDYIYHAAAYKHVPLMEDSPAEAIRTNVIGTYNVAKMADKYGVKKMVLVSTDKAVRPTNVMGATKRFAETIIQYYSEKSKNTAYAAVRFGNVLGSNGSVVPLFKKQIEAGGPVTVTDKRIIRYFMTIPEAVSLILQCGLYAKGGEIFILDMGQPVKILDLAEKLIRQAGFVPYIDIQIEEIGLRPGEKLFEELLIDIDHQQKTENKRIYIEDKEAINSNLESDVLEASKAFDMAETSDVKTLLKHLIKTYKDKGDKDE